MSFGLNVGNFVENERYLGFGPIFSKMLAIFTDMFFNVDIFDSIFLISF